MDFDLFYSYTMDARLPFLCSSLYVIYSIKTNNSLRNVIPRPRANLSFLTFVMVIHNIILFLFSLTTFMKTFPVVLSCFHKHSLHNFMFDPQDTLKNGINFWVWIFYVSKIYEIVDSLILHWNKRPTSFLQMYHHAGAIICCWLLAKSDSHLPWIFVVINSFIHSMMYLYYLLVTLKIKVPTLYKRSITRMQIIQFVSGSVIMIAHLIMHAGFSGDWEKRRLQYVAVACNLGYVFTLFVLFRAFEKRTYEKKVAKED